MEIELRAQPASALRRKKQIYNAKFINVEQAWQEVDYVQQR